MADCYVQQLSAQVGPRESRQIVGPYALTGDDVHAGRKHPDAVARGSWWIDIHCPLGHTFPVHLCRKECPKGISCPYYAAEHARMQVVIGTDQAQLEVGQTAQGVGNSGHIRRQDAGIRVEGKIAPQHVFVADDEIAQAGRADLLLPFDQELHIDAQLACLQHRFQSLERRRIEEGAPLWEIERTWAGETERFRAERARFLLYD